MSVPASIGADSSGKRWLSFAVSVKESFTSPLIGIENDPSFAAVDVKSELVREFFAETITGLSGSTTAPDFPTSAYPRALETMEISDGVTTGGPRLPVTSVEGESLSTEATT